MTKPLILAAALLVPALAGAQTTTTTTTFGASPSQAVTQLAPQLIAFAGGQSNFDSLVTGLALGSPVTLVSTLPTGQVQTVTFTPQGAMTPTQIAQTLESARQSLISRGIGAPTAQQVAISLTGGALPTQSGNVPVTALLPSANQPATAAAGATGAANPVTTTTSAAPLTPSPAALMQGQSSAGGTTPPSPAQIIQNQRGSNISDTPTAGNISNTPSATGNATTTNGTTAPASSAAPLAPAPAAGGAPFAAPAR